MVDYAFDTASLAILPNSPASDMHITEGEFVGSKATCMGAEFQGPYIDDQFLLTEIYSTPLATS